MFPCYNPDPTPNPDPDLGPNPHQAETMFHENIFRAECWYMALLQITCCVWVTTHVYFVDLKNVC